MEESPEIFKKPTRPKNIRKKFEVPTEESTDEGITYATIFDTMLRAKLMLIVTINKRISTAEKKKKAAIKKTFNALSFDDDEKDAEEFQVKKTKATIQLDMIR